MSYSREKFEQAKQRYLDAIKAAQCSLLILAIAEKAGGELPNPELVQSLMDTGYLKAENSKAACIELELDPDGYFQLDDEMLDFGLEEIL